MAKASDDNSSEAAASLSPFKTLEAPNVELDEKAKPVLGSKNIEVPQAHDVVLVQEHTPQQTSKTG